ncbi:hypothetical protein ACJX0J_009208, partial [Zea mays]
FHIHFFVQVLFIEGFFIITITITDVINLYGKKVVPNILFPNNNQAAQIILIYGTVM